MHISEQKQKNSVFMRIKNIYGEKSHLFAYLRFFCFWCFVRFWCLRNLFVKKKKEFKTALITSFILLLRIFLRSGCLGSGTHGDPQFS